MSSHGNQGEVWNRERKWLSYRITWSSGSHKEPHRALVLDRRWSLLSKLLSWIFAACPPKINLIVCLCFIVLGSRRVVVIFVILRLARTFVGWIFSCSDRLAGSLRKWILDRFGELLQRLQNRESSCIGSNSPEDSSIVLQCIALLPLVMSQIKSERAGGASSLYRREDTCSKIDLSRTLYSDLHTFTLLFTNYCEVWLFFETSKEISKLIYEDRTLWNITYLLYLCSQKMN